MKMKAIAILFFFTALTFLSLLNAQTTITSEQGIPKHNLTQDTPKDECCSGSSKSLFSAKGPNDPVGPNVTCTGPSGITWPVPPTYTITQLADYCNRYHCTRNILLPVELSSFTATILSNQYVQLNWITQSETEALGYYVYRSTSEDVASAIVISPLIPATNTSTETDYTYVDDEVNPGKWYYWLQNIDLAGDSEYHGPIFATVAEGGNGGSEPVIPAYTSIQSVYPNPFNPTVTISYKLAKTEDVCMGIYNQRGQKIQSLICGIMDAGAYRCEWNGRDKDNRQCASGVYCIRMIAGKNIELRKIILLK